MKKIPLLGLFVLFLFSSPLFASPGDTVLCGNIKVIVSEQALIVPARASIDSGILEYLAVAPEGKAYESVMILDCKPMELHTGLLLIHAKPGGIKGNKTGFPTVFGDTLLMELGFRKDGKDSSMAVTDLFESRDPARMKNEAEKKKKIKWVFTGSELTEIKEPRQTIHAATVSGSMIALFSDPAAEINCSFVTQSPYNNPVEGFQVKKGLLRSLSPMIFLKIRKK
jgi:hypothetical protein